MASAKQSITDLRNAVETTKQNQKQANDDIKKLERDMDEFKNNKDGKIDELKVCSYEPKCYKRWLIVPVACRRTFGSKRLRCKSTLFW